METGGTPQCPALPPAHVTWRDGTLLLRDERVFGPGGERLCEGFLGRVLGVEGVCSVSVDRAAATAAIRCGAGAGELAALRKRLSHALRNGVCRKSTAALPRCLHETSWTIYRHGQLLTSWRVLSERPGRLHLSHPALRWDRTFARAVERRLRAARGVIRATVVTWPSSLFIHHDPSVIDTAELIRLAEEAVDGSGVWGRSLPEPAKTRFGLPSATLGIAALGEFALPALSPLSALLLVGTNLRTFKAAWQQIRGRQLGLPVLYTAIAGAALASGQFVPCALMSLCYKLWHHRLGLELASQRKRLLRECLPRPSLARLITRDGGEVLVALDRLGPGDRVVVDAGETIPADGRVTAGEAIVDEQSVCGHAGARRKGAGDSVLAGSTVLAGFVRVQVAVLGTSTRASSIARALVAATSPKPGSTSPALRTEAFADRAVVPTLATAGVGLLVGDLTTFAAILPPDYATGPGVTLPLETLRNAALCARRGIVVRQADVFERLANVELIVLDDHPALSRVETEVTGVETHLSEPELLRYAASAFRHLADDRAAALNAACRSRGAHLLDLAPVDFTPGVSVIHGRRRIRVLEHGQNADGLGALLVEIDGTIAGMIHFGRSSRPEVASALARIRALAPVPIALVSNRAQSDVAALAALLGVEMHKGAFSPDETARFLRACRARGIRAAYICHARQRQATVAEAYVAISLGGDADEPAAAAGASLLQPRMDLFADLWEIAHAHEDRIQGAQRLVLFPNILCVAGAFFFGFTSLAAVMITNFGTFSLYNRAVGSLRELEPTVRNRSRHRRPARQTELRSKSATLEQEMSLAESQVNVASDALGPPTEPPAGVEDSSSTPQSSQELAAAGDEPGVRRIKDLPKEIGVMLVSVGVVGFILPGVIGTPAIIAGGLVLWPGTFGAVENWFRRRNHRLYQKSMRQIGRFLDDLERRYPGLAKN